MTGPVPSARPDGGAGRFDAGLRFSVHLHPETGCKCTWNGLSC